MFASQDPCKTFNEKQEPYSSNASAHLPQVLVIFIGMFSEHLQNLFKNVV